MNWKRLYKSDRKNIPLISCDHCSKAGTAIGIPGWGCPYPSLSGKILVSRKDEYITIEVQNVCFIHSQQNITRLYLTDGISATIPYTLDQLEKEMNPASFFRANRQHMIQVRHIKKVSNWFNYKLKVEMNGYPQEEILISREKAATFKKWLDK